MTANTNNDIISFKGYNAVLETELDKITYELVEGLDAYLDYAAMEWMKENKGEWMTETETSNEAKIAQLEKKLHILIMENAALKDALNKK